MHSLQLDIFSIFMIKNCSIQLKNREIKPASDSFVLCPALRFNGLNGTVLNYKSRPVGREGGGGVRGVAMQPPGAKKGPPVGIVKDLK